jgi:hypothetical protein
MIAGDWISSSPSSVRRPARGLRVDRQIRRLAIGAARRHQQVDRHGW